MKTYKEFVVESYELTEGPNILQQGLSKLRNLRNYASGFVGNGPVGRVVKRIPGAGALAALGDPVSAGLSLAQASTRLAPLARRLNPVAFGLSLGSDISDMIDASRGRSSNITSDAQEKAAIARANAARRGTRPAGAPTGGTRPAGAPTGGTRPAGAPTGGTRPAGAPTGGTRPAGAPTIPQSRPTVPRRPPMSSLVGSTPTAPRATATALSRTTTASTRPIVPTTPTKPVEPTAPPVPRPTMPRLGQNNRDSIFSREGGRQEYERRMRQAIRTGTKYQPATSGSPAMNAPRTLGGGTAA